ncbi:hypothetical protein D9M68_894430 [compost metagenome]
MAFAEVAVEIGLGGFGQGLALPGQPLAEQNEITPVRVQRVAREALFEPERVDKSPGKVLAGRCQGRVHHSSLSFCLATTCL